MKIWWGGELATRYGRSMPAVVTCSITVDRNGSKTSPIIRSSGVGIAPLPTTIADMDADLIQVLPPVMELTRGWYLLTHPDLRKTPRICAFFDFTVENLDVVRPILMG